MRQKKQLVRLTESDLHRIIKESVNKVLKENLVNDKNVDITWEFDGTEVYVNNVYAGYIDRLSSRGWYGKVYYTNKDGRITMMSFGVAYNQTEIQQEITDFINNNADNVLSTSIKVEELNKGK